MTTPSDIFDKPEYLLRIWESEKKTLEVNASLVWENVKHFGAFISALLVAQMALMSLVWNINNPGIFPFDIRETIFIFPIAIFVLTRYAEEDLRERWKRFLLVVTHLLKLEDLLGLHEDIGERLNYFKEDKYLFVEYQGNLAEGKSQLFIDSKLDKNDKEHKNTYTSMSKMYRGMKWIAIGLILFGIFLFLNAYEFKLT